MRHIFARHDRSLTGTPRYASINNHLGVEQSRRDDLESVAYILIYFIKGSLPWQGLKSNKPEHKYRLILQKKQQVSIAQLCQGCPPPFAEFLAYSRSLKFDAKPDIPYLRRMFRQLYHELGCGQIVSCNIFGCFLPREYPEDIALEFYLFILYLLCVSVCSSVRFSTA